MKPISRFFCHYIISGFPVRLHRRQEKLQSNFMVYRSRLMPNDSWRSILRYGLNLVSKMLYFIFFHPGIVLMSSFWPDWPCSTCFLSCQLEWIVVHSLVFFGLVLLTDVFHATEGWKGFRLTNDLTSRITNTADLHLSKCLLTTSLSSQNPTLISDVRKYD